MRDAPGHFRTNLFPVKDGSGAIAKIAVIVVEVTKLREFEKCLIDLIGHLPRVRDQIVCLGLPNREQNDKIQSWLGSIEMLEKCVRQIHGLAEMLRPPALLSTIGPYGPHQISLPYFPLTTPNESTSSSSVPEPEEESELSPRLRVTAQYLAQGKSNKEIASTLGISVRTVDHYREAIMLKLDLHSLTELVRYAVRHKLISL
jgi:DNA-binding CsgD family transcriptional regulator